MRMATGLNIRIAWLSMMLGCALLVPGQAPANVSASLSLSMTLQPVNRFHDSDGDGVPDLWELQQFGVLHLVTALSDFDRDGFLDHDEYVAGTDPKDPNSLLQISQMQRMPDGRLKITWDSTLNTNPSPRLYDLYYAVTMRDLQSNKIVLNPDVPSGGDSTIVSNAPRQQ
jgi:hypothetical protein